MKLTAIGIDFAKNVFQACGVNEHMKPQFNKRLKRNELLDFMRQQAPTMVVMEACYSSHYWRREMTKLGHNMKLIPAQHVTPFVRGNKNDPNNSFAIIYRDRQPSGYLFRTPLFLYFLFYQREHFTYHFTCLHAIFTPVTTQLLSLFKTITSLACITL